MPDLRRGKDLPQANHLAHDDEAGPAVFLVGHLPRQGLQGALDHPLAAQGAVDDEGRWRGGGATVGHQAIAGVLQHGLAHEEHQGLRAVGHAMPLVLTGPLTVVLVEAEGPHGIAEIAVGDGDARRRRNGTQTTYSGHRLKANASFRQCPGLFAPPAEEVGISALEADDSLALPAQLDQELIDLGLRHHRIPFVLAHIDALGLGRVEIQQGRIGQGIVEHDFGAPEGLRRLEGQQPGVPGTRPDQGDRALPGGRVLKLLQLVEDGRADRLGLLPAQAGQEIGLGDLRENAFPVTPRQGLEARLGTELGDQIQEDLVVRVITDLCLPPEPGRQGRTAAVSGEGDTQSPPTQGGGEADVRIPGGIGPEHHGALGPGFLGDPGVGFVIIGGDHHQKGPPQVRRTGIDPGIVDDSEPRPPLSLQGRSDDPHLGIGFPQLHGLAQGDPTPTQDHAWTACQPDLHRQGWVSHVRPLICTHASLLATSRGQRTRDRGPWHRLLPRQGLKAQGRSPDSR